MPSATGIYEVTARCPCDRPLFLASFGRITRLTDEGSFHGWVRPVTARELIDAFWAAMQANDWDRAAGFLAPECQIDWPCSGERIVGRADFAALQRRYPSTTGRWSFDLHRVVSDGHTVVSEVTVSDGVQAARVIAIADVEGGQVVRQVEYWPTAYEPRPGREDLTLPIDRVP